MLLKIKPLVGEIIQIEAEPTDNVSSVIEKVSQAFDVPSDQVRLIYKGFHWRDHQLTLQDCKVKNGATIEMVIALRTALGSTHSKHIINSSHLKQC